MARPAALRTPQGVPTQDVPFADGVRVYSALSQSTLRWLLAYTSAVELHGWACTVDDPLRARFARILLEQDSLHRDVLTQAGALLRDVLGKHELQAIPLLSGRRSLALWIPLAGAPYYSTLRTWLHALCAEATRANPALFALESNTHASGRVHLRVGSNAPGRYSALPYSLRRDGGLHVCTPVAWDEIHTIGDEEIAAQNFAGRLAAVGDIFGAALRRIGDQPLPALPPAVET